MSNIVLLTAAGIGSRTHQFIPKQFLSVKDKPIILYTMEKFQNHPEIDKIAIVCLKGWEDYVNCYAKQFNITKLKYIVAGGNSGYESIQNGLNAIKKEASDDDIVLIHDGNRPGVSNETISDCISVSKEKGSAITCIPTNEVVYNTEHTTPQILNRDYIIRTQTPHGAQLKYMLEIYDRAKKENIPSIVVAFCSLLSEFKQEINFVKGSEKNFKITYKDDIDLFKGLVELGEFDNHDIL